MSSLADADAVPPPAGAADGSPGSFPAGYDIDASRNAAESPAAVQKAEAEAPSPAPTADPPELVASMDATRAALSGALPPGVVASLCSARLLARPPYRVVVGVLLALVAERGFGAGLLEAHEAAAPMALDKRGKLFVIARIIAAARHALGGGQLRATPEHVLAGASRRRRRNSCRAAGPMLLAVRGNVSDVCVVGGACVLHPAHAACRCRFDWHKRAPPNTCCGFHVARRRGRRRRVARARCCCGCRGGGCRAEYKARFGGGWWTQSCAW